MKPSRYAMTILFFHCAATSAASDWFYEVGVGLTGADFLSAPQEIRLTDSFVPSVSIGVGYTAKIETNWQLQTSLSISHTQLQISTPIEHGRFTNGRLENTGLWLDSRLALTSLSDRLSPFFGMGIGKIHGHYEDSTTQLSGWESGARAYVGLEYKVTDDSSFSFALGRGDASRLR